MRIKRGVSSHKKHKKLLESTSGYRMSRHRLIKVAKEASLHAGQYAYSGRRRKKSQFRNLWISSITAELSLYKLSYSKFIYGLKKTKIELDRKILSYLAKYDSAAFKNVVDRVKTI